MTADNSSQAPAGASRRGTAIRNSVLAGALIIVLFFGGLGGWAAVAPLAGAALAPGVVSPEGSRRIVQHLEGGIIGEILVEDGNHVAAGDPLVVLDDTQARAAAQMLMTEYQHLSATFVRLSAEQAGADTLTFPEKLVEQVAQSDNSDILAAEQSLFGSRLESRRAQQNVLRQRIAQLHEQIVGLTDQIDAQTTQLTLIGDEIKGIEWLVKKGLAPRPRLLALQRNQAQIAGEMAQNQAAIAQAEQAIGGANLEIIGIDARHLDQVAAQLIGVQSELSSVGERHRAAEDILTRTIIDAPVAGTVVDLRFHTAGGVIAGGAPVLDIVPVNEDLVIEARVSPLDIDSVHQGLPAQIHLSAYRQRILPRIEGVVQQISADRLIDPVTGEPYFLAEVQVNRDELANLGPDVELLPGMPAEVMIMTTPRTAMDYFLGPVVDSFRRSFRES